MCIAFDGAYILEAPTTHPPTTDEPHLVPALITDNADTSTSTESAEWPVPLESAIR